MVVVYWRHVLRSAEMALRRPQFNFNQPVKIVLAGEEAIDEGGPKREFFR